MEYLQRSVASSRRALDELTEALQVAQVDHVPDEAELRARLTLYYSVVNPEKLEAVDDVLESYRGREATLFARLDDKYSAAVAEHNAAAVATHGAELEASCAAIEAEGERDAAGVAAEAEAFAAQRGAAERAAREIADAAVEAPERAVESGVAAAADAMASAEASAADAAALAELAAAHGCARETAATRERAVASALSAASGAALAAARGCRSARDAHAAARADARETASRGTFLEELLDAELDAMRDGAEAHRDSARQRRAEAEAQRRAAAEAEAAAVAAADAMRAAWAAAPDAAAPEDAATSSRGRALRRALALLRAASDGGTGGTSGTVAGEDEESDEDVEAMELPALEALSARVEADAVCLRQRREQQTDKLFARKLELKLVREVKLALDRSLQLCAADAGNSSAPSPSSSSSPSSLEGAAAQLTAPIALIPSSAAQLRPSAAVFKRLSRSGSPIAQWHRRVEYAATRAQHERARLDALRAREATLVGRIEEKRALQARREHQFELIQEELEKAHVQISRQTTTLNIRKEEVDLALRNLERDVETTAAKGVVARREVELLRAHATRDEEDVASLSLALAAAQVEFKRKAVLLAHTERVGEVVQRQLMGVEDVRSKGVERMRLDAAEDDLARRWQRVRATRERLSGAILIPM